MRYTLTDIAREAGVSAATVDRVINNRAGVRGRTREVVIETARRLGYISTVSGPAPPAASGVVRLDFVLPVGTNTFMKMLHHQLEIQSALRSDIDVHIHAINGNRIAGLGHCPQTHGDRFQASAGNDYIFRLYFAAPVKR